MVIKLKTDFRILSGSEWPKGMLKSKTLYFTEKKPYNFQKEKKNRGKEEPDIRLFTGVTINIRR